MNYDISVFEQFLNEHQSQYVGKYRFHSGYRTGDKSSKYRYYMLDQNFRQIDIYVEIQSQNTITYSFSEDLHEQEKIYIVKDALRRIINKLKYKSTLHYSLYENYLNVSDQSRVLEPVDFINVLNYMKYHRGINQKTMDDFYALFIPCLKIHLDHKNYEKFLMCVELLFQNILYENEWDGTNSKYLDTEYQYHLYYIREIIRIVYKNLDHFYKKAQQQLFDVIEILCKNPRFSFAIMTDFGSMVLSHYFVTSNLIDSLKDRLVLYDKDEERKDGNLVFSYIYYIFHSDYDQYHAVILILLREIIGNILTFANHDLDLAIGNSVIQSDGYQILLDLFHEDYNTFVFTCFPIDTFPVQLRPMVQKELVTAIQYFAARMNNDNYRLSSFEQVMNINRLLMDNFKEWYK